jgi:hypothetical protein
MLDKKNILLLLVSILTTTVGSYKFYSASDSFSTDKQIEKLDTKVMNQYQEKYNENKKYNTKWGIPEPVPKSLKKKVKKKVKKDTSVKVKKVKNQNSICIEDKCFRLLGTYADKDSIKVSLYSKSLRKRIKLYSLNEVLAKTIYISKITHVEIEMADKKSNRKWYFKQFDVNPTKYKPKDINETDF